MNSRLFKHLINFYDMFLDFNPTHYSLANIALMCAFLVATFFAAWLDSRDHRRRSRSHQQYKNSRILTVKK